MITDPSDGVHQRNFVDSFTEGVHVVMILHLDAVDGFVTKEKNDKRDDSLLVVWVIN